MSGLLRDRESDHLAQIRAIAENSGEDSWACRMGLFHRTGVLEERSLSTGEGIINDDDWRVVNYLNGIDALWQLGEKVQSAE